ncbi:MAG TPA: enolase C-terminal domain-like protein [Burkholderiales bacterium]|nr:enolase C-terminal domain-like protein [Burkholderiales bacterium]
MTTCPMLTVRDLRVRAVNVPMRLPLQTSGGTVGIAPLALIDLHTEEGVTGCAYLFCYTPLALKPVAQLLANLAPLIKGDAVAPFELDQKLQRQFRLLGAKGVTGMAMAGIYMAAWDALAKAQCMPLAKLLGGGLRRIPAYNSCGLGMIGRECAAAEAQQLAAPGFQAIKVRLGYPDVKTDISVVRAVRRSIGDGVQLMADYNQSLSVPEAITRTEALAGEGLYWVEEPTLADDYEGHAQIRSKSRIPIQMGENWWGPHEMAKSVAAGASDLGMPDAMKIGGVTGWMRAAAIAETAGLPVSSHLFPEISAHLLAVSPTRHWLEYVDWASPVLQEPLRIENGHAMAPDAPGTGMNWDEASVERYLAE